MNLSISINGVTQWDPGYKEATVASLQRILDILYANGRVAQFVDFDIKLAKELKVNVTTGKALPVKLTVVLRVAGTTSAETAVSVDAEKQIAKVLADLVRLVDPIWFGESIEVTIALWGVHDYQVRH
jgi:hypothetical protein